VVEKEQNSIINMEIRSVGISDFIKEHTSKSIFDGDWETVREEVSLNKYSIPGYRDGVILVPVNPKGFHCPVIKLKKGDKFRGQFDSRVEGEEPRKRLYKWVGLEGLPEAKSVNIILYHKDVLLETHDHTTGADWDMIAVQALDTTDFETAPMDPTTLMYQTLLLIWNKLL
jgi:hypothetical protein